MADDKLIIRSKACVIHIRARLQQPRPGFVETALFSVCRLSTAGETIEQLMSDTRHQAVS